MAVGATRRLAKPLTRSTKAGVLYTRPLEVETQLEDLLRASAADQLERANIVDRAAPLHVKDECLVYLIREAALGDDAGRYNALVSILLRRCTRSIKRSLRNLGVASADLSDVFADVVEKVMSSIVAEDGRGEFYQARFRRGLRFQLLKVHQRYDVRREHAALEDSLNGPMRSADDGDDDAGALEDIIGTGEDVAVGAEQRMVIAQALAAIRDPRHREAFVLRHYADWLIESEDPLEPSIVRRFGVERRTVNNWLRAAKNDLAAWCATKTAGHGESST